MGLKDLFKSKSSKLRPDPRIRWFGKLPSYPDYYSSQTDEEWTVEFNDWVLKGFELYRSRVANSGVRVPRLPTAGCAIRLPKSGVTVFASILDYGGDMHGRPFPMCFYVSVPTVQWPGPTSDCLVGASRVFRDLLALRHLVPRFLNTPGRFETTFGNREVDLAGVDAQTEDASWKKAATGVVLAEWFGEAKDGIKLKEAAPWLRAAHTWGESLMRHESKTFEPTLRFPLAMRLSLDAQIAGWIRWLEERMDLTRRTVSLMVRGELDAGAGSLTVIARDVVVDDFLLLSPLTEHLPYLDDLSQVESPDGSQQGAKGLDPEDDTASSGLTWADFVCAAARTP